MQRRFDEILSSLEVCHGKVLLAVSGGIDSMVLADLFFNSAHSPQFGIAHCNFHLRGEESDGDEALVCKWASDHGIEFHKKDFQTSEYAASNGVSIEMAARALRYAWFAEVCSTCAYDALVVAHNANDNAETMVLNLLRGTGLRGITGMKSSTMIPCQDAKDESIRLLRPMLNFSRSEILEYAKARGLAWREDSTNADSAYKRNCIRNEVFPLLEKLNPSFLKTLNEDMERFSQERRASDEYFKSESARVCDCTSGAELLKVNISRLLSSSLPDYVLFRLLEPWNFPSAAVDSILELLGSGRTVSGKTCESELARLVTTNTHLVVMPPKSDHELQELLVEGEGDYSCAGVNFSVKMIQWAPAMPLRQDDGVTILDADKLGFPFVVRPWREGDWMCPLGVKTASGKPGRKKLSDMFVDLKMSVNDKEKALVVVPAKDSGSRVFALLGKRIDEACKVSSDSKFVVCLSVSTI